MTAIVTTPARGLQTAERAARAPELAAFYADQARALIEPLAKQSGTTFEVVMSEVYMAIQANPDLAKCTPASLIASVMRIARWGLVISETAHLVPFGARCQAVRDYKGSIQLVVQCGAARSIDAHNVYENEIAEGRFELQQGDAPKVIHRPILDPAKRGKIAGAYAIARLDQYHIRVVYMDVSEIDAIRKSKSKSWANGSLDKIPWYPRKTVVHQVTKALPKSLARDKALAALDDEDEIEDVGISTPPAEQPPLTTAQPENKGLSGRATEQQVAKLKDYSTDRFLTATEKKRLVKWLESEDQITAESAAEAIESLDIMTSDRRTAEEEKRRG